MVDALAIMFTFTTKGTWMRGDARGWIDDGMLMPADPSLEAMDRTRMKHSPFRFQTQQLFRVGQCMGDSLRERLGVRVYAMAVQTWHAHVVIGATPHRCDDVAKCAKDAVRWGLRLGRPIWTTGYDTRFCFDARAVEARVDYVQRHNTAAGLPAQPWAFIEVPMVQ